MDGLFALSVSCYPTVTPKKLADSRTFHAWSVNPLCVVSLSLPTNPKYERMRMNQVRQKIKNNFDALESAMNAQRHLDEDSLGEVLKLIEACSKYWRVLDDEHRDFLNAVRFAIEEGKRWE